MVPTTPCWGVVSSSVAAVELGTSQPPCSDLYVVGQGGKGEDLTAGAGLLVGVKASAAAQHGAGTYPAFSPAWSMHGRATRSTATDGSGGVRCMCLGPLSQRTAQVRASWTRAAAVRSLRAGVAELRMLIATTARLQPPH